jgi:hypothetical protein
LKKRGPRDGVFIRLGASDRQASAAMAAELRRSAEGISFDRLPAPGAQLSDLNLALLGDLLGREADQPMLRTLRLVVEDQGRWVPSNGGVLVGSDHPEMFLPHAWVQCARFRGSRRRDIVDKANVRGPLPLAIGRVMDFFRRHAFLSSEFGESPRRRDVWSVPLGALEELVVNSLVHSSYDDHGTPIKVAFRDEEIVIDSPGGLVPGLTVEDMLEGTSVIRNPVLARVFEELGHIEQWGSGIPEVVQDLAEAGLPPLGIDERRERLRMTVRIPNHDPRFFEPAWQRLPQTVAGNPQTGQQVGAGSQQVSRQVSQQVILERQPIEPQAGPQGRQVAGGSAPAGIGPRGAKILAALADGPLGRGEALATVGLKNQYRSYQRHILPLIEGGLVSMTSPETPTAWTQAYALTAPGRAALAAMTQLGETAGSRG